MSKKRSLVCHKPTCWEEDDLDDYQCECQYCWEASLEDDDEEEEDDD